MASDNTYLIRISAEAEADINLIVSDFIDRKRLPGLANWLAELDRIKLRLTINPYLYQPYLVFLHRANIRQSSHFLAYAIDSINREVEILMVAHLQQDPARLARRINL